MVDKIVLTPRNQLVAGIVGENVAFATVSDRPLHVPGLRSPSSEKTLVGMFTTTFFSSRAMTRAPLWLRIVDSYPEHLRGVDKSHPWPVHRAQPLPVLGDHSSRQFLNDFCSRPIPDVVGSHGQNQQGGVLEGRQMGLESIAGVVLESVCAVLVQRTEKLAMVRTLSDHVAVKALEVTMWFDMTVTREQVVDPHLQQGERFCKPLFGLVLTVLLTFSSHRFFTLGCGSRWKMKTPSDK